jgi:hypothetical protein
MIEEPRVAQCCQLRSAGRATCVALVVAAVTGCQGGGLSGNPARITAKPVPYIPDVPVPTGFTLVEKTTDDYTSGGVRVIRHDYDGRADRAALRNFYQEQMPAFRWVRISDQNVKGEQTMRFEKGNEACTITIRPKGSGWFDLTLIRVTIVPFDRSGRTSDAGTVRRSP